MFQMDCSNCRGIIKSPDLVELQVITCPQCEEAVQVKNVVVASKDFSISFGSSLKKMLLTAKDKFRLNKSNMLAAQTNYEVDKRLARLLRRDDFRLDMSFDLYVQVNFQNQKKLAKLLNISSEGAGIEFAGLSRLPENSPEANLQLPEIDSEIFMELPLPGDTSSLLLPGRVVWSKVPTKDTMFPSATMGVRFRDLNEKTRACLWDFIIDSEIAAR